MSMKKVVFSSLILLTIITLYITKNNTNKISELIDNNMLAFTIDGENSSFMPKKGSGYKVKSITCKNNSNVVWDNDNWEIEVIKLESEDTCVIDFTTETNFEYAYTGNVQTFTAPTSGEYTLEVWGAQGGTASTTYIGGYGGYSTGTIPLNKGDKLYIYVGNQPASSEGGYNGGGTVGTYGHGGGGATHIAKSEGLLSTMSSKTSDILIVAGGGGGSVDYGSEAPSGSGGHAGGYIGGNGYYGTWSTNPGKGGTQTSGGTYGLCSDNNTCGSAGTFGQGGSLYSCNESNCDENYQTGGGGGFYGGGSARHTGGGGGSGYIASSLLTNKVMYCYNCEESSQTDTKTIKTTTYSETPTSNSAKLGNGYAKITKNVEETSSCSVKVVSNSPESLDSTSKTTIENGTVIFYKEEDSELISGTGCTYQLDDDKIIVNNVNKNITCNFNFNVTKTLYKQILADKTTRPGERTNFGTALSEDNTKTLYTATEDNTTVYYFAGNALDNWVKFGGYYWRIIRTNSDGSVRILYHGTSTTATDAYLYTSTFSTSTFRYNDKYNDSMYVGYMYGTSGSLEENRTNTNNSTIKSDVDNWYRSYFTNYTKYLSTTAVYCNDRNVGSGTYSAHWDEFYYAAYTRLITNKNPTYDCSNIDDKFTVDSNTGNGKLSYPIALMTMDELAYAGGGYDFNATPWYYYNSSKTSSTGTYSWWTMSPAKWYPTELLDYAMVFMVNLLSPPNIYISETSVDYVDKAVLRPVISLKGDNEWKSGDGSATNPYEIVTE